MLIVIMTLALVFYFAIHDFLINFSRILPRSWCYSICKKSAYDAGRLFFAMLSLIGLCKLRIHKNSDLRLPPRFIIISNHQSLLDIPIFIIALKDYDLRFVSKKEVAGGIFFITPILKAQGHALVDRKGSFADNMKSLERFSIRCKKEGSIPTIFPEGTRSRDGNIGTFYAGGLRKLLENESLPILITSISASWKLGSLKKILTTKEKITIDFKLVELLEAPKNKKETNEFLIKARNLIQASLENTNKA